MTITAALDVILIIVLLADIVVHALRWRAERAAARDAASWPPYDPEPGPAQDEGGGSPEPGTVAR